MNAFMEKIGIVFFFFLFISYSHAGLGDEVEKVSQDKIYFKAKKIKITLAEKFNIHEIEAPEYKIREYVNTNKKVFAVSWSGLTHPDLKPILSSYYDEYLKIAQSQKRIYGRRFRVVKSKNVTVVISGHMRNLKGKAYLHSDLPLGVAGHEIH